MPQGHDSRADAFDGAKVAAELQRIRELVQNAVVRMPSHEKFISQYCPAKARA
jgi:hypothetical protein